ncbi:hypothetical protein AB9N12_18960 [Bacteroides sp. AN502(2024)]|uniref:hypothetical protein n=1 Tax=Bacteroides sp. AN502(2024) TaxID=3160599 RepID=UPI003515CE4E
MKVLYHTIWLIAMTFIAGVSLSSCVYDGEDDSGESDNIRINTMVINGSPRIAPLADTDNDKFVVLFWREDELASLKSTTSDFPVPYLSREAPQSVEFYNQTVYDTGYPYPYPETALLYATGYAPTSALTPEGNFRTLKVNEGDPNKGRHDFLGCDLWPEAYRGSQSDPFAKDKNKLYFRHLAAKLKFYADRDRESMENKQFVRNVRITNLYMRTDDGNDEAGWHPMHTPSEFQWDVMKEGDFTSSYKKTIDEVKATPGNEGVSTMPQYGYRVCASEAFSGNDGGAFVLHRNAADRVPISGMYIDSCYVCNPIETGAVSGDQLKPIRLKMNISAELSFRFDFPLNDGSGGSLTDDLTFTRTWTNVQLSAIYPVGTDGKVNQEEAGKVKVFEAGKEYRIYIHFYRTGVNLTALEMPWNQGGVHYITISGDGIIQPADEKEKNK